MRFSLDTAKSKLASYKSDSEKTTSIKTSIADYEKRLAESCAESIKEMNAFIQYVDGAHSLKTLIDAQAAYHKRAYDILTGGA